MGRIPKAVGQDWTRATGTRWVSGGEPRRFSRDIAGPTRATRSTRRIERWLAGKRRVPQRRSKTSRKLRSARGAAGANEAQSQPTNHGAWELGMGPPRGGTTAQRPCGCRCRCQYLLSVSLSVRDWTNSPVA